MTPADLIERGFQGPTSGRITRDYGSMLAIAMHPAFRLGFLDAQYGRPLNHDGIADRIARETPEGYFKRSGNDPQQYRLGGAVEYAQYRYEEGRLAVLLLGLRCRAWGHPDFPPAALRKWIWDNREVPSSNESAIEVDVIAAWRQPSSAGPLFEMRR